jgi:hypothetical protein
MALSSTDRNKRRALIVRRQAAYLAGRSQRELWRQRREALADELDAGEIVVSVSDDDDLLG